jgi:ubiquinone/menaquinone biosynthesis C-methylase UbiE
LGARVVTLVGQAEAMPLPDACVDLAVSRGSIFFWDDPARGISEAHRVLRPGGQAMIGGGLGSAYPAWARREFIRRRHGGVQKRGPEAVRRFRHVREPATFRRWAEDAGLTDFQVLGEGGLPADDPRTGLGIWLRFGKEAIRP